MHSILRGTAHDVALSVLLFHRQDLQREPLQSVDYLHSRETTYAQSCEVGHLTPMGLHYVLYFHVHSTRYYSKSYGNLCRPAYGSRLGSTSVLGDIQISLRVGTDAPSRLVCALDDSISRL